MSQHPDELVAFADEATARIRQAIMRAAEQDGIVGFRHETQVHKAIDLLRGTKSAPELLARLEAISCSLAQLRHFKREGRVNLYASRVLQLRRALLALAEANGEAGAGNRQHTLAASS